MPEENTSRQTKKYIVTNERGEEFLLPKYAATFRILMDDKETIRDVLNSLLQLDHEHEITELEYEFEKRPPTANMKSIWDMPFPFRGKIGVLTPTASAAALGHKIMQA